MIDGRIGAVLWDMDGTLVDTEPYWFEREHELVNELGNGRWNDEHSHAVVGFDLRESARYIRHHGGIDLPIDDLVNLLLDGVIARVNERIPWRPGARELLAEIVAAGIPTALVTMSWKRFADAVVRSLPAGTFTTIVTGDDVANGKPHPEPYLIAAATLGVEPSRCIAIEDSPTGIRSAVAAGCRVVVVPNMLAIADDIGHHRLTTLQGITIDDLHVFLNAQITPCQDRPMGA